MYFSDFLSVWEALEPWLERTSTCWLLLARKSARKGVNPFTKEPRVFKAKTASIQNRESPTDLRKDAYLHFKIIVIVTSSLALRFESHRPYLAVRLASLHIRRARPAFWFISFFGFVKEGSGSGGWACETASKNMVLVLASGPLRPRLGGCARIWAANCARVLVAVPASGPPKDWTFYFAWGIEA